MPIPTMSAPSSILSVKFWVPVAVGRSVDLKADLRRADELVSQALSLDPNFAPAHVLKANILNIQGRLDEAIVEDELRACLGPDAMIAYENMGNAYLASGNMKRVSNSMTRQFGSVRAIQRWLLGILGKANANFGLKQYDQAIKWARQSIANDPNKPFAHGTPRCGTCFDRS